ncbi:1632_t:CDS:2 [Dentiscutata heterogama]|uniref:1632_t:CDS:1 n=1 Tax=Dentiscutata heterogama TaxID=1316150 RepID=A0ACA9L3Z6_9GLOM|nr:1632_t:CDS:2 [Dentiscutata heterogama]
MKVSFKISNLKKHPNYASPSQQSKKNRNNDNDLLFEVPQWVDIGNNKTSFVWKHFGLKTDGRAYCRYIVNQDEETECGWNCIYNSQTSSMIHHLGSAHKIYEEKLVKTNKNR